jgi:hypothetical protein
MWHGPNREHREHQELTDCGSAIELARMKQFLRELAQTPKHALFEIVRTSGNPHEAAAAEKLLIEDHNVPYDDIPLLEGTESFVDLLGGMR